tara:strand:- start:672 stop:1142 length:471 start_codon:yes stop_codon:yes gene_type:complete
MNFYETMYIIHPALQAGRLEDMIDSVHKKIDSLDGKRLYSDNWGKKKLSYAIDKQKYGTYVLMQFSMDALNVKELSHEFEHNSNILRYLTNRIEETDVLESKEENAIDVKSSDTKENDNKEEAVEKSAESSDNEKDESSDNEKEDTTNNKSDKTEE